jgi:uncharacterized membrane protein YfcA
MIAGPEIALPALAAAGIAAVAAGIINALAGGGTLVTFPALLAIGIPEVAANITNTVALCPGYLGGSLAQKEDLKGQGRRLLSFLPAGILGGIAGGFLLLVMSAEVFRIVVPFLILGASLLLAVQERVKDWIGDLTEKQGRRDDGTIRAVLPVGAAAVYGGYFGAGQSVIVLSVLGLFVNDTLTRLNALKQCITLASNVAAAVFFLFSGMIVWPVAVVMAAGALVGGAAGGRLAGRVNPETLRWTVVSLGLVIGIVLLARLW